MDEIIADILIPIALDNAYSYAVPPSLSLKEGDVVWIPLGRRETQGVVWGLRQGGAGNLKPVTALLDAPPLSASLRGFIDWMARYTLAPRGCVLALALKGPIELKPEPLKIGVRLSGARPKRSTPARLRALEAAAGGEVHGKRALAQAAGVSISVIEGLIDEGAFEALALPPEPVAFRPDPGHTRPRLSAAQDEAAEQLRALVRKESGVALLEGVTGSGKTEVYFEAVAEVLRQGKQALILMPEIALTAQFIARFEARFGAPPALWHSQVTARKRERLYASLASGETRVVAGARSALFLPYAELGLIVVDEEHEGAYKQADGVHYHARDMAVVRGRFEACPVILASATPSLESRANARRGRYRHVLLPERYGPSRLPRIETVDLRAHPPEPGRWLSPPLVAAMRETMAAGEQTLLFLNRRGYAPLTLCRACGHRHECRNCSAWLVEHRFRRALICHHCGHTERRPDACPDCGTVDGLTACGPGVERIAEEAALLFPEARSIVLSSDFPGGVEKLRHELSQIAANAFDIVIGTQLAAKGHHFPHLTLVGVLDADIGLTSGDPRAAERTFQMLQQVTGRAGREEKPGRGLVQTFQPDHPVIAALLSHDAERFYEEETFIREAAELPPFGRLAALIVSGYDRDATEAHARALAREANPPTNVTVLGPAEAPLAMIRRRYRFRLLVRTKRDIDLQHYLRDWLTRAPKLRGNLKLSVDVDPQSFL